ncbi:MULTISPECIES: hypothetical protein [Yersinia]|uniref:Uncharacterized protein n=1 Tax=Yersinia frederiksenii TaxID=29484 RepID=A0AAI8ZNA7_YERFR|nr:MULTISPECIES: hypothetical protein [Yersinia]MDN0126885.1 hypothetical protein [Yersinia massiliensis]CFQ87801.1 Uncharacterised protein [Yersinia frederiksenii]
MNEFDFRLFWRELSEEQKEDIARKANTTVAYIKTHLVFARRIPSRERMKLLHSACSEYQSDLSLEQLLSFFYAA